MNRTTAFAAAGLAGLLCTTPAALAEYVLTYEGRAEQLVNDRFTFINEDLLFTLQATLDVQENGVQSDATVTFTSPNLPGVGRLETEYFGDSGLTSSGSGLFRSANQLVNTATGTWLIEVEEANDVLFQYEADVVYSPGTLDFPYLVPDLEDGDSIVNGFEFDVLGDAAVLTGSDTPIRVGLRDNSVSPFLEVAEFIEPTETRYDFDPDDLAAFVAIFDPNDLPNLNLRFGGLDDPGAFSVTEVRAITPGAPDLSFGSTTVGFTSSVNTLVAVPEPASLSLLAAGSLTLLRRRHA
ncbi:MAG: PEP-CTERM sorting domain-containing protein [Planctomycetota bacterium]